MALLDVGEPLVERIKALCPSFKVVQSAEDIEGVLESSQVSGSAYIVLGRYTPISNDGGGITRWRETWLVVSVVKFVRQGDSVQTMRSLAAPLLAEVLAAVDGWRIPGVTVGQITPVPGPDPLISKGFGYFPLAFSADSVSQGVTD